MTTQHVDYPKCRAHNVLVAKKSRGKWSVSQDLVDQIREYSKREQGRGGVNRITFTAIVEAGLIGFFEADDAKKRDLLAAAKGFRPMTAFGREAEQALGVQRPDEGQTAPIRKASGSKKSA